MAVAATQVGAQPPAIKCRICGRPSLRGAKLCDECVAAVKRARHMSTLTSEFLPHPGPGRSARPPPRAPGSSPRPRATRLSWLPTKPGAWGVFIAFTLFGAAVVGTAYLAVQEISEPKGQIAPSAIDPSVVRGTILPQAPDAAARTPGSAVTESPAIERSAASPGPAEVRIEVSPAVVESPQATPLPDKHMPRKAATENRNKPSTRAIPAASGETGGESKAATAAPEPAEAVPPPAPASAPEPPVRDRWETMNAALAACSSETLLAGVMCTEHVRYQYCEGFWGQVPQCRAATRPGLSR